MKHLQEEDIARLIEGNVPKEERENFMSHLSRCETCFEIYSETLQYAEEERKKESKTALPEAGTVVRRFLQTARALLAGKGFKPVFAVLALIIVLIPFLLIQNPQHQIKLAQLNRVEKSFSDIEPQTFSDSRNKISAAVRAGMLMEALNVIVEAGNRQKLETQLLDILQYQLPVLFDRQTPDQFKEKYKEDTGTAFPKTGSIASRDLGRLLRYIEEQVEKESLGELFGLGRFVEKSVLDSFVKKPAPLDVDKYMKAAGNPGYLLPPGVMNGLRRLKTADGNRKCREILIDIEEVLLSLE